MKVELTTIKAEMKEPVNRIQANEKRIIDVPARSMRDNLIFYNIPESKATEDPNGREKLVKHVIKGNMEIQEEVNFERVQRMGAKFNEDGSPRTRPIVAKFSSDEQKEKIKGAGVKLKNTNLGVNDQLRREIQERRKVLWPVFKAARNQGH